jgi:hypothetical protein
LSFVGFIFNWERRLYMGRSTARSYLTKDIPPRTVQKRTVSYFDIFTSILFNIAQTPNPQSQYIPGVTGRRGSPCHEMNRRHLMLNSQVRRIWFMVFVLGVLLAGCGRQQVTPTPSLTSINPSSRFQGEAGMETLTGTNFAPGSTISVSGAADITVSNTTVVSSTQITATFAISAAAAPGARNVTVTSQGLTSNAVTFTVNLVPPTVTSTSPANGATNVPINLRTITATFSKAMNPATITAATFVVTGVTATAVAYNVASNTATFTLSANLAPNTLFTARITAAAQDTAGNALVTGGSAPNPWTFMTGSTLDTTAPTVIATDPANTATAVPINKKITATFSKAMNPATITTTTFTVTGPGATPVAGTVTYAAVSNTAIFTPSANLAANTLFTATITVGAQDTAGHALAGGGLAPNPWTFMTGSALDTTAPTVTFTNPANAATGVAINASINATFSKAMDPSTINTGTFTVAGPGVTPVTGTLTYNPISRVATFTPASNLANNALFTATVTTGAKDLAGNPLAPGPVPNPWTFTTGATTGGQPPVNLRSLSTFVAVAGAGLTNSNSGGLTTLNGDVGLSPTATCLGDGIPCTALNPKINGTLYANDPAGIAAQAKADLLLAYTDATGRPPGTVEADLSGMILGPGVYTSGSTMSIAVNGVLTLDGKGDANAVWIFQVGSALTVNNSAQVLLINGAKAANVFWAVGSSSTLGTNVSFKGSILAQSSNSLGTLSVVEGRMLCSTGQITLLSNTVTLPAL